MRRGGLMFFRETNIAALTAGEPQLMEHQ